jgi:hypothetical protein
VVDSGIGTATFDGAGRMTQLDFSSRTSTVYTLESGGSQRDFGTDGVVAWGRWIGPVKVPGSILGTENYDANRGLHYVVGMPTPSMPQTGTATYTLLGATQPTYIDGSTLPGIFSGTLSVGFAKVTTVNANFTVAMPDRTYGLTGSAITSSANFFINPQVSGCINSSCGGIVQGFFAGPTAERAGVGYHIGDVDQTGINKDIVGAAAFKQ